MFRTTSPKQMTLAFSMASAQSASPTLKTRITTSPKQLTLTILVTIAQSASPIMKRSFTTSTIHHARAASPILKSLNINASARNGLLRPQNNRWTSRWVKSLDQYSLFLKPFPSVKRAMEPFKEATSCSNQNALAALGVISVVGSHACWTFKTLGTDSILS